MAGPPRGVRLLADKRHCYRGTERAASCHAVPRTLSLLVPVVAWFPDLARALDGDRCLRDLPVRRSEQ